MTTSPVLNTPGNAIIVKLFPFHRCSFTHYSEKPCPSSTSLLQLDQIQGKRAFPVPIPDLWHLLSGWFKWLPLHLVSAKQPWYWSLHWLYQIIFRKLTDKLSISRPGLVISGNCFFKHDTFSDIRVLSVKKIWNILSRPQIVRWFRAGSRTPLHYSHWATDCEGS